VVTFRQLIWMCSKQTYINASLALQKEAVKYLETLAYVLLELFTFTLLY